MQSNNPLKKCKWLFSVRKRNIALLANIVIINIVPQGACPLFFYDNAISDKCYIF